MNVENVPFFARVLSLYAGLLIPHSCNNESAMICSGSTRLSRDRSYQSHLCRYQKTRPCNKANQSSQDYYASMQWILNRQVSASQT